jgi:heme/copper-type cytochrome/quinol oxidase subunit 2
MFYFSRNRVGAEKESCAGVSVASGISVSRVRRKTKKKSSSNSIEHHHKINILPTLFVQFLFIFLLIFITLIENVKFLHFTE